MILKRCRDRLCFVVVQAGTDNYNHKPLCVHLFRTSVCLTQLVCFITEFTHSASSVLTHQPTTDVVLIFPDSYCPISKNQRYHLLSYIVYIEHEGKKTRHLLQKKYYTAVMKSLYTHLRVYPSITATFSTLNRQDFLASYLEIPQARPALPWWWWEAWLWWQIGREGMCALRPSRWNWSHRTPHLEEESLDVYDRSLLIFVAFHKYVFNLGLRSRCHGLTFMNKDDLSFVNVSLSEI